MIGKQSLFTLLAIAAFVPLLAASEDLKNSKAHYSPYASRDYPENLYWGDTHLHTERSVDAYAYGNRLDADTAYRFARGETIKTLAGHSVRIGRPLDFLVVSDHAHYLGAPVLLSAEDPRIRSEHLKRIWNNKDHKKSVAGLLQHWGASLMGTDDNSKKPQQAKLNSALRQSLWKKVIAEADKHNQPGVFTAFIGFEWTSMPDLANLHRVVIFRDNAERAGQITPFSVIDSRDPEDLWAYLQSYEEKTAGKALAIPHNGNLSRGLMFPVKTYKGGPLTQAYARTRTRWEPIYEVTQMKGDGETHPTLSPSDIFADYETWTSIVLTQDLDSGRSPKITKDPDQSVNKIAGEYARSALKRGLEMEQDIGVNPFKFGMIGSSDTHTSLTTVEENNFFSKFPYEEPTPERVNKISSGVFSLSDYVASGLAAVWARENTRESIFDAMQRRETYASTGSRIKLRFFGGWEYELADHARPDYVDIGYRKGVPMGGELAQAPPGESPRFLISAAKDPDGANLERIQIVKGWINADGTSEEKVWDVVLSDRRQPRRDQNMHAPITSTVDVANATYTNDVGEAQLSAVWVDPSFDPDSPAFYYVRVLEIPTPRWTTYDAAFFDIDTPSNKPVEQQERAYSSPIWYTPFAERNNEALASSDAVK